ncbi:lipase family protein [Actinomycetes bacterium KLBMP 9797]
MSRWNRIMVGVTVALVVTTGTPAVASDDRFRPPPGTPLRVEPLPAALRLAGTGAAWRIRYASTSWNGRPTVVSGTVSVPVGPPPAGGWRLVGFGPGFNGTPDACAASEAGTPPFARPLGEALLAGGYAVAVTDYEGIGTPGDASGVDGRAEAYALIDVVRAARRIAPVTRSWAAVGYSMGGHAALWAGARAAAYAPGLRQVGTVALAPTTQWALQFAAAAGPGAPVSPFVPYVGRTLPVTSGFQPDRWFTPRGLELVDLAGRVCVAELAAALAGVTNADVFRDPAAALAEFAALFADDEVPVARYPRPVRLAHGTADPLPAALTEITAGQLAGAGSDIEYVPVAGADHFTVLAAAAPRVLAWLGQMFAAPGRMMER